MAELLVQDLTRYFGKTEPVRALDGVGLTLDKGRTLGVVGESGCGKSTLGRVVVGLDRPTSGEVLFRGAVVNGVGGQSYDRIQRRSIQMIFQDPYASLNPRLTVARALAEPIRNFGLSGGQTTRRIRELMDAVGLPASAADKLPHEFSGGQRQRIGIARALAAEPSLIVADEAVSALDVSIQAQIVNLLGQLSRDFDLTLLFISHDMAVIEQISDNVAVMYLGQIVEIDTARQIFAAPAHPYTRALIASTPDPDPRLGPIEVAAQGEIPSPRRPPSGCRFHTRCPLAIDRCRIEVPALRPISPTGRAACHLAEAKPGLR